MELSRTVMEMQSTLDSLKDEQKLMETAFKEQQNELRLMQEKVDKVGQGGSQIVALGEENVKHKEAEIEDLKRSLENPVNDHPITFPEVVAANGTMEAQNESGEEDSSESAKHEGDDNEDASKSELTKSKDGDVATEIKDEMTEGEIGKANEDPQNDGGGETQNTDDADVVYGREKKVVREAHAGQVQKIADGEKQLAGMKRKHGHARRAKGKRWRTTVNSSLMENNNVVSDNHMGNRKVYKDKSQANLLKPGSQDANVMKVNTKHQVTSSGIYPDNQRLDEMKQSEVHEQTLIHQNWSKTHIKNADKNAGQTKTQVLLEGPKEPEEILHVQKQNKDGHDDEDGGDVIFKKSHSEFQDENNDYKEESEYQSGL